MSLPECALEECPQQPTTRVKSEEWGFPRTKKLCEEHAEWAVDADGFEVLGDEPY